ncbi:MAG: hypothetical protein UT32_C0031G0005 [Parcubacteria group bacterium GW2011_GWC2_39_14]|nr:MAG: hypothetical protein UT32_C0031G0005 [Parcubacteria group bacterium GW2011_GWC2_39_14]KKR53360.1 MAG: hypothetical protein UT91_C0029G0006 [Parcubacteria group bacterium GW2011_GWA2_40_23]
MSRRKIAIFVVSDIYQFTPPKTTGPIVQAKTVMVRSGVPYPVYSTGRLELALSQGYTVYVVNEFDGIKEHDQWWIALLGSEKNLVFTPGIPLKSLDSAWPKLARRLRLSKKINWKPFFSSEIQRAIFRLSGAKGGPDFIV